jgi:ATP-binding cassette subfamily B protein/subfamily B ATP-binding cassette protein MsbA
MNHFVSSKQRYRNFLERYCNKGSGHAPAAASPIASNIPPFRALGQHLKEYARWLWPYRIKFLTLLGLALMHESLQMIQPLFSRYIIDEILVNTTITEAARITRLQVTGTVFLAVVILSTLIGAAKEYDQRLLNAQLVLKLGRSLYRRLLSLPLDRLSEMKTGGILSRLSGDIDATSGLSHVIITSPLVSGVSLAVAIGILAGINWRLALISAGVVGSIILLSFIRARHIRPVFRMVRNSEAQISARVGEVFSGIRVVRAYCRERHEFLQYARGRNAAVRMELFAQRKSLVIWACWNFFLGGVSVAIVWYGARLNLLGRISVGDIVAFQWYTLLLLTPAWNVVSAFSELQRSLAAMDRVFEVLAMNTDKPDRADACEAPTVVEEIRFDNVEFAYHPDRPVVRNCSVSVPAGSMVALVGRSGAGKTTIMDLAARFHDPTSGRVLLNGCDIREMRLRSYRKLLGTVRQEAFLFDGSVRDNIKYGKPTASDEEMEDAAARANAHEFILNLPEQYDTFIGERGVKLSGGEQQRLAIARAILASPQILILDEATSSLDSQSEELIQASMCELLEGRTTFVIAHRLSTVRQANLILVMEAGYIVERGTHNQLMRKKGIYYHMVMRQSGWTGNAIETCIAQAQTENQQVI